MKEEKRRKQRKEDGKEFVSNVKRQNKKRCGLRPKPSFCGRS